MPAPPPPPPPMGSSGPPPIFKPPKNSNDRDALLKSIQKGAKLKKTVTVDKSAPMIGGASKNTSSVRNPTNNSISPNGISSNSAVSPTKNFGSIQMELKKQLANVNENRNRGPPPPAPNRNISAVMNTSRQPFIHKENATNGIHLSQLCLNSNSNISINSSTLHRKAKSNANLSTLQINEDNKNVFQPNKLVVSHGKPNLAPKPPVLNGKPNLQPRNGKPVSRAHSLKSPRSPSPQSPEGNPMNKFGTVRHMSSVISQSLANSSVQNSRSRPVLNGRPSAPPPSIPTHQPPPPPSHHSPQYSSQHPPPPKVSSVKHPSHAPPPPPPAVPQAPSHAPPPPPPHKTQTNRPPVVSQTSNNLNPPPPPPRHSSIRDAASVTMTINLDEKFKNMFKSPNQFPQPPPYKNVIKIYNCKPGPITNSGYVM